MLLFLDRTDSGEEQCQQTQILHQSISLIHDTALDLQSCCHTPEICRHAQYLFVGPFLIITDKGNGFGAFWLKI